MSHSVKKQAYFSRLTEMFGRYNRILLVNIDNVGSLQLQQMRTELRGEASVVMGKNTMIRRVLRSYIEAGNEQMAPLLDYIVGNIGLVFTNGDLSTLRERLESAKRPAAAKAGTIAPLDVWLQPGGTGLEPTKTQFMQALDIATKIVRGQIEIQNPVHLIKAGARVGASQAQLLQMLDITPFTYGLKVITVYDSGFVYGAELLSLTDADVMKFFSRGVQRVAALSLSIGYPTIASVPHTIAQAYRNVVSLCLQLDDYTFPAVDLVKEYLANPDAFAPAVTATDDAPKQETAAAPEPEPSSSEDLDLDLFG